MEGGTATRRRRGEAAGRGSDRPGAGRPGEGSRSATGAAVDLPALADLLELTKPRITVLVAATAATGFLVAGAGGALGRLVDLLVGTLLLAGGTNALNQLIERGPDGRMARTRDRPLPAGRVTPAVAGAFGAALVAGGVLHLLVTVNALTAALGLSAALLYAALYTPLKRVSSLSLSVGAVPGALPVLGGWTAARGTVDPGGLALFGILFLWQLPHFLSLGWMLRDDYRRAGFAVLAVEEGGEARSRARTALSAVALVPASLLPFFLGLAGWAYAVAALLLGARYLSASVGFARVGGDVRAQQVFRSSLWYLPALLLVLVADATVVGTGAPDPHALAHVNASLNAAAAVALGAGFVFIRRGEERRHWRAMLAAAVASGTFLVSYLVYHVSIGSVPYEGAGWDRTLYLGVLVTHAVLAAVVLPLAIVTVVRGLADRREAHRRIARWTWPAWMYVSLSGLLVYLMLYRL